MLSISRLILTSTAGFFHWLVMKTVFGTELGMEILGPYASSKLPFPLALATWLLALLDFELGTHCPLVLLWFGLQACYLVAKFHLWKLDQVKRAYQSKLQDAIYKVNLKWKKKEELLKDEYDELIDEYVESFDEDREEFKARETTWCLSEEVYKNEIGRLEKKLEEMGENLNKMELPPRKGLWPLTYRRLKIAERENEELKKDVQDLILKRDQTEFVLETFKRIVKRNEVAVKNLTEKLAEKEEVMIAQKTKVEMLELETHKLTETALENTDEIRVLEKEKAKLKQNVFDLEVKLMNSEQLIAQLNLDVLKERFSKDCRFCLARGQEELASVSNEIEHLNRNIALKKTKLDGMKKEWERLSFQCANFQELIEEKQNALRHRFRRAQPEVPDQLTAESAVAMTGYFATEVNQATSQQQEKQGIEEINFDKRVVQSSDDEEDDEEEGESALKEEYAALMKRYWTGKGKLKASKRANPERISADLHDEVIQGAEQSQGNAVAEGEVVNEDIVAEQEQHRGANALAELGLVGSFSSGVFVQHERVTLYELEPIAHYSGNVEAEIEWGQAQAAAAAAEPVADDEAYMSDNEVETVAVPLEQADILIEEKQEEDDIPEQDQAAVIIEQHEEYGVAGGSDEEELQDQADSDDEHQGEQHSEYSGVGGCEEKEQVQTAFEDVSLEDEESADEADQILSEVRARTPWSEVIADEAELILFRAKYTLSDFMAGSQESADEADLILTEVRARSPVNDIIADSQESADLADHVTDSCGLSMASEGSGERAFVILTKEKKD
jgi:hypothetical protein